MIKKIVFIIMALLLTGVLFLVPDTKAGDGKINIRFSTWHVPAGADVQKLWIPMLEEMKKRSDGRITYTMYAGGALGKGPQHYDIVKTGLSDMGYATLSWTPGRFPLTDVLSSPIVCPAKWKGVEAGMAMHDKLLHSEFKDVKVLHINNCVMAHLWTTRKVTSLEDLKGMKIRSPGGLQTKAIEALGATPIFMPLGDVYLSMETGVIDGVVTCPALVKAFKLYEVAEFGVPTSFGCVSEGLFVNKRFWKRVPDDLKEIIEDVGRNAYAVAGIFDEHWYENTMSGFKEKINIVPLTPEEQKVWDAKLSAMLSNWASELETKGLPAKKALTMFKDELEKVDVHFDACPY
ncbi:TRAP-type C4-dicarboxylate transport system, substrate-binding protein [Desulfocicer vacuolatum DSM 3385]|uniref:TRAP-type C4-dicarboxylate transport system, substrate-binding protein n=1 Tax=Desulfocicer vacuolatum DSM 3385 TaxID=1121400 RepID=A0A1W2CPW5_9BACT|nr:TRAP transporter substrate-binding protein [Desulfocicer vacuolatum]SMC87249.1 TRAP-type C4-dicarboxylate transport system, substrate-binding protein [Desulfocicer vacuolatum DSM 3385]